MTDNLEDILPYTAQNPWWVKLLGLPAPFIIVSVLLFPEPGAVIIELQERYNWALASVIILGGFGLIPVTIQVFMERTIFHKDMIEHHSLWKKTQFRRYSEVRRLEYRSTALRITFLDGKRLDIFKATGDIVLIGQIINVLSNNTYIRVS